MSFSREEKDWLRKYEDRFVKRGFSQNDARYIRNAVTDIDLTANPEACADDEASIFEAAIKEENLGV